MYKVLVEFLLVIFSIQAIIAMEDGSFFNKKIQSEYYIDKLTTEPKVKIEKYLVYQKFEQLPLELQEMIVRKMIKLSIVSCLTKINNADANIEEKSAAFEQIFKNIKILSGIKQIKEIFNDYKTTVYIINLISSYFSEFTFGIYLREPRIIIALALDTNNSILWLKQNMTQDDLDQTLFKQLYKGIFSKINLGYIEVAIAAGANVNAKQQNDPFSLLYYAILHRRGDVVNLLIKSGANVNYQCPNECSLLHEAKLMQRLTKARKETVREVYEENMCEDLVESEIASLKQDEINIEQIITLLINAGAIETGQQLFFGF